MLNDYLAIACGLTLVVYRGPTGSFSGLMPLQSAALKVVMLRTRIVVLRSGGVVDIFSYN
jgi:hypothetical protein